MPRFNETAAAVEFIASAASRETSPEIMEAIAFFANDEAEAAALWNGDGFGVICSVTDLLERVTHNGRRDAVEFFWGAAGSHWAADLPHGKDPGCVLPVLRRMQTLISKICPRMLRTAKKHTPSHAERPEAGPTAKAAYVAYAVALVAAIAADDAALVAALVAAYAAYAVAHAAASAVDDATRAATRAVAPAAASAVDDATRAAAPAAASVIESDL